MIIRKLHLVLAVLVVGFCPIKYLKAQNGGIRFQHLALGDGLSNNSVYTICQDKYGYLWFGGEQLDRYNAYEITNYPLTVSTFGARTDFILNIFESSKGILWLASNRGVLKYDRLKDKFKLYNTGLYNGKEIGLSASRNFLETKEGILYVLAAEGIFYYDTLTDTFQSIFIKKTSLEAKAFCVDKNNNFWVGFTNGELIKIDPATKSVQKISLSVGDIGAIYDLLFDERGRMWIGTVSGLIKYDQGFVTKYTTSNSAIGDNYISDLHIDSNNQLWIGTDTQGISILNLDSEVFQNYKHDPDNTESLAGNSIICIYSDNSGLVWISSLGAGLSIYDKNAKRILHFKQQKSTLNSLSNNYVHDFYESPDGLIYIATDKGSLNSFDPRTHRFQNFKPIAGNPSSISSQSLLGLSGDGKGNLWIASWGGGLNRFNLTTKKATRFYHSREKESIAGNNVWDVVASGDSIYLAIHSSPGHGFDMYDRKREIFLHYTRLDSLNRKTISDNSINKLFLDSKKLLWLGLNGGGVNVLNTKDGNFEHYDLNLGTGRGLSNGFVKDIFEDSKHRIWLATRGGLNLFIKETNKFISFGTNQGFPTNEIVSIQEDDRGNLWLGSNRGIIRFNPETLSVGHFTRHDGLQSNEFVAGSVLKTKDGMMYFGGVNGFNVFHPDSLFQNNNIPQVRITGFSLFNKPLSHNDKISPLPSPVDQLEEIELTYDQSFFTIDFVSLNFVSAEKNQYAYRLDNFDKEWNQVGNRRSANYTNVPPGEYVFRVKASNNDNVWNEKGAQLKIIIRPPFWETWLFRSIAFTFIVCCVITFYRLRITKIKRQKRALEHLVNERTQEIVHQKEEIQAQRDQILESNILLEKINSEVQKSAKELIKKNALLIENYQELEAKNEVLQVQKREIIQQKNKIEEISNHMLEVNEQKIKFFTNISHELRTPLTLILGPARKLASQSIIKEQPPLADLVNIVASNANRLLNLINELLDLRKIDERKIKLAVVEADIVSFVKNILALYAELAENRKVTLEVKSKCPCHRLYFDPPKIDKIIHNLISNAFKHSRENSTVIVELKEDYEKKMFLISVTDNGKGIEPHILHRIFERYYSHSNGDVYIQNNSGIGLSLANELAEIHHGSLSVTSLLNKETTFVLSLPSIREKYDDHEFADSLLSNFTPTPVDQLLIDIPDFNSFSAAGKDTQEEDNDSQLIILIVEDNKEISSYLKSELIDDYKVYIAEDGLSGEEKAMQLIPDIIITDLMMPRRNGVDFTKAIKKNAITDHIPVIMVTALAGEQHHLDGLNSGADDYITKPINVEILKLKLKNVLETRIRFRQKILNSPLKDIDTSPTPEQLFLVKVNAIIELNLNDSEFQADRLADELCMSKVQLYRKLKAVTEQSINNYIRSFRLKKALILLKQKHHSISEIAYEVGFKTSRYFSQSFKEEFGVSPTDFKDR